MARVLTSVGVSVGLMGAASILSACPAVLDDRCAENACVRPDAAADSNVPDAVVPADCDQSADAIAPEAKGCVVDSFALFVDGEGGDDTSDGSKAKPLRTIGSAITKVASTGKRRIYVCGAGTYPEHLALTTATNLYGGFACKTWEANASAKPKVAPTDKGYALSIEGVSAPVTVSDFEISAADAATLTDGTSSIAVFTTKANVTLLRTLLHASDGGAGAKGQTGDPGVITMVSSGSMDAKGNPGSGATGGLFKTCTCSSSPTTTKGGGGGSGGTGGGPGEPNYGAAAPKNGAAGLGSLGTCSGDGPGKDGADAPATVDAPPSTTRGALGPSGWEPTKGADGSENGKPGQGGGGGGAIDGATGASGGGCGGCGGFAGKGGGGGGASIALLIQESTVSVKASTLETKAGGAGGVGGSGGIGAGGGTTGTAGQCAGGTGGRGADGSAGAGGAGGVSIGILYQGTAPTVDGATTINVGAAGAKGKGGKSPANDGLDGIADKVKDATQL